MVAELGPETVLVHDPHDTHEDHVQTARAALAAARGVPNVLLYEGPSTVAFAPQASLDVGPTWSIKLDALRMYVSQASRNHAVWAEGAARFRSWPRNAGGLCEAFRVEHAQLTTFVDADDGAGDEVRIVRAALRR